LQPTGPICTPRQIIVHEPSPSQLALAGISARVALRPT
jgi:hypothetical protein